MQISNINIIKNTPNKVFFVGKINNFQLPSKSKLTKMSILNTILIQTFIVQTVQAKFDKNDNKWDKEREFIRMSSIDTRKEIQSCSQLMYDGSKMLCLDTELMKKWILTLKFNSFQSPKVEFSSSSKKFFSLW